MVEEKKKRKLPTRSVPGVLHIIDIYEPFTLHTTQSPFAIFPIRRGEFLPAGRRFSLLVVANIAIQLFPLSFGFPFIFQNSMEKTRVPQVNLAVVGGQGVGKSTFIKFALDLKERPISRSSIKKMSLDGTIYQVRLLEIAIDQVTFDKRGHIVWPSFLGEQTLPAIDGVLALYDSTDLTSLARFPRIFGKRSSLGSFFPFSPRPRCFFFLPRDGVDCHVAAIIKPSQGLVFSPAKRADRQGWC